MLERWRARLLARFVSWMSRDGPQTEMPLVDFACLRREVKPADVLLVQGHSRVSGAIQSVTHSSWSHAALYAGRLGELESETLRAELMDERGWGPEEQLLVESDIGRGTVIVSVAKYHDHHVRICRPAGLSPEDAVLVVRHMVQRLGTPYDLRQILDLLRLLLPFSVLPRRWRSTLFDFKAGSFTRAVCSSMIAEAFASVRYPILPVVQPGSNGTYLFRRRNHRHFTPRDFDQSPYFSIIKYPFLDGNDIHLYREMPWDEIGVVCNDPNDCFRLPEMSKIEEP